MVVIQVPSPYVWRANWKFHTAGKIDPYRVAAWKAPSSWPKIRQIGLVARDDKDRHFREVLHEPLRRRHQSPEVVVWEEFGDHRATGHSQIGLSVQGPDLAAKLRITDDDPAPRLMVRPVGGLQGDPQALTYLRPVNRRGQIERPASGSSRGEELLDIHSGGRLLLWTGRLVGEEYGKGRRRAENLTPDVGVVRLGIEVQLRQAIEEEIESNTHLHPSQVHAKADVGTMPE